MSAIRAGAWVAFVAFVGCATVLGLDETAGDTDHDGIADPDDNCPTVANLDQLDTDGDGIGDACDDCTGPGPIGTDNNHDGLDDGCEQKCMSGFDIDADGIDDACDACLLGPPHDEDGDGIDDACDNCPARVNPDQEKVPFSRAPIGTVCLPNTTAGVSLTFFDPFTSVRDEWLTLPNGWSVANDVASVDASDGTDRLAQTRINFKLPAAAETRVQFGAAPGAASIVAHTPLPADLVCSVDSTGMVSLSYLGTTTTGPQVVPVAGGALLRLELLRLTVNTIATCATDAGVVTPAVVIPNTTFNFGLSAHGTVVTFAYAWLAGQDQVLP